MSSVSPRPYDLCTDIPEVALDPEWRTLVRQAVHTLTAMLKRSQRLSGNNAWQNSIFVR
jgi:hypothetical protein